MKKAIIYYTDNNLQWPLALKCRKVLLQNSNGIPIISVSQKPVVHPAGFGKNICMGRLGRSYINIYLQILAGLESTDADIVYLCEHDVLYTKEHFELVPSGGDFFYYNTNHWFLDWSDKSKRKGMYFPPSKSRFALSQLVSNRQPLIDNLKERVEALKSGLDIRRKIAGTFEPGVIDWACFVDDKGNVRGLKYVCEYEQTCMTFKTDLPNIDIRNGQNFTGFRRAKESLATYDLAPWGRFSV
jgi:hypothetical protein